MSKKTPQTTKAPKFNQAPKASKAPSYKAPKALSSRARLEEELETLKAQLQASLKAPKAPKAPKASQASPKGQPQAKAPKADKAPKAPSFTQTAKVVELKPGLKGSVKHSHQFEGQELAIDLQAASQAGDSYILKAGQLTKAAIQAIDKALSYLPSHKGQGWKLDNLQVIPN